MKIRTLIVDDEPPALGLLREMTRSHPDLELVGEASSGTEAEEAMRSLRPDLVFLDIRMPDRDGFSLLHQPEGERLPLIVFTTAYGDYAVRAFDVPAVDYLLKPFDEPRFARAVSRAKAELQSQSYVGLPEKLSALLTNEPPRTARDRLVVKSGGRLVLVNTSNVDWIEADGNYAVLHVGQEVHPVRQTMQRLEETLDPATFIRIHRSAIVNVERIASLQPWPTGEYVVTLRTGKELTLSRNYRTRVLDLLGCIGEREE